eukprot:TRINITY_DN10513_c0_g1_i1.p1 TRINITY_DN10513_c0_g1~~TRINITY_DN10513_c0_g1_i1.p1  ORF type:complete len:147 (-),score=25.83 TRINITY_DN10513_c0_g1_i1:67-507(-)
MSSEKKSVLETSISSADRSEMKSSLVRNLFMSTDTLLKASIADTEGIDNEPEENWREAFTQPLMVDKNHDSLRILEEVFKKMDPTNRGYIDVDQLKDLLHELDYVPTRDELATLQKIADNRKDGRIRLDSLKLITTTGLGNRPLNA